MEEGTKYCNLYFFRVLIFAGKSRIQVKESDKTFESVKHVRQKLLSSSVNYCRKRWKLNYIVSRTMLIMINSDNNKSGKA